MSAENRVTGVDKAPNVHGDQIIEITCADGRIIDAAINLAAAQLLVEILQRRLVRWAAVSAKSLRLPQAEVTDIELAHQGPAAQLMVTTVQMGRLILQMPDDVLRKAKHELERLGKYRFGPTARN